MTTASAVMPARYWANPIRVKRRSLIGGALSELAGGAAEGAEVLAGGGIPELHTVDVTGGGEGAAIGAIHYAAAELYVFGERAKLQLAKPIQVDVEAAEVAAPSVAHHDSVLWKRSIGCPHLQWPDEAGRRNICSEN